MTTDTTTGDCFPAALAAATALVEKTLPIICHGRPFGRGGTAAGIRYWHAWVEVKKNGRWMVLDVSNGGQHALDRASYYALGKIYAEDVARFTPGEAAAMIEKFGTYGPWVDGWETMTDEPS